MEENSLKKPLKKKLPCVTLIGMPASGKTTIGQLLAGALGWSFMDTDKLLEALYACRLQDLTDLFGKEKFLEVESDVLQALDVSKCVIAPGGSVIYSEAAMKKLASLGPVIYLAVPCPELARRVNENPERGIAIAPGQTFADLYVEREALYKKAANLQLENFNCETGAVVERIVAFLKAAGLTDAYSFS